MAPTVSAVLDGSSPPTVLDGGLGTALEARGLDLDHDLWSAALLRERPEILAEVHAAFAAAGAQVLTTASYQISPLGLARAGLSPAAGRALITDSVAVAREAAAREAAARKAAAGAALIAGSVGPYGAALGDGSEYTGDYRLTAGEFAAFHRPRIDALVDSGVDVLALETQPCLPEIRVLAELVDAHAVPAWLTVTLSDDGTHLPDGTPLSAVAEAVAGTPLIRGLGVNCVRPSLVAPALAALAAATDLPLIAYPNSGETYDAATMRWTTGAATPAAWPVATWTRLGARLIGGCCRTTPDDIAVLAGRLRASSPG
ncbi:MULTISPECIES: homocysteine S-methyltransferase [unclassified Brevibacterium]|uniref:homocysteine S-methyltransferase n=1 Tax=unclassified Brevibacterium TaxID=2614124 RepID=UPI0010F917C9|nr:MULTISPECIES: homocysteine S-methyltransferase [unclassified Brevibacterium]MCM1013760.1 homocysteine S-methyltransferase [Brevibacterium sp. XM4083]